MVDVRAKGAKAETDVRNALRKLTGFAWERTPGSGALDPKHLLKGDLYIPGKDNKYCVECKHYAEDHFTSKILSSKNPQLLIWWDQAIRQALQIDKLPLLIFKHDRSKLFVAFMELPNEDYIHVYVNRHATHSFYVALLEDWILQDNPKFIK